MDLEILFWIVVIVLYFIFQVRGAAKRGKGPRPGGTPPQPADRPGEAAAEPTMDDALREIRIALGMEVPEAEEPTLEEPEPEPEPKRATAPTRLEQALPDAATQERPAPPPVPEEPPSEFQPIPTRYADAEFESRPTPFGSTPSIHREPTTTRVRPKPPKKPLVLKEEAPEGLVPTREGAAAGYVRRLRNPEAAREAFILGEILGRPVPTDGEAYNVTREDALRRRLY